MAKLNPYLFFQGKAAEAMQFYKGILGGDLYVQKVSESPVKDQMAPEMQDKVIHAALTAPGITLYCSDLIDGSEAKQGNTTELCLECDSKEQFEEFWAKLLDGGSVMMEKKEEFFGYFGSLNDKYGIAWMLQFSQDLKKE